MTTKQLMESVSALGFEREVVEKELFFSSANRALSLIFTDLEVTRTVRVSKEPMEIVSHVPKYRHTGEQNSFPLSGKAYSFTSSGTGKYKVTDGYREYTYSTSGNMTEHRGFIDEGGSITFFGDYAFTVYDLTCFGARPGEKLSDVPIYDGEDYIDIASIWGDYLSFTSLPVDDNGRTLTNVSLREGKLSIRGGVHGGITVTYRRAPSQIFPDDYAAPIDVPREAEVLLPLLTSAFMWLDDDPEKAQYYMALYQSTLITVRSGMNRKLDAVYSTNGWA